MSPQEKGRVRDDAGKLLRPDEREQGAEGEAEQRYDDVVPQDRGEQPVAAATRLKPTPADVRFNANADGIKVIRG